MKISILFLTIFYVNLALCKNKIDDESVQSISKHVRGIIRDWNMKNSGKYKDDVVIVNLSQDSDVFETIVKSVPTMSNTILTVQKNCDSSFDSIYMQKASLVIVILSEASICIFYL
jgi:tetrahydromethanopterin S-methyltransferase subunit A